MVDGYTTVGFRVRRTHSTQHSDDVGVFLPYKVHHRTAYCSDKSEVYNPDRYKYQIDRSAKTNAIGSKGFGIKYSYIGELYN